MIPAYNGPGGRATSESNIELLATRVPKQFPTRQVGIYLGT